MALALQIDDRGLAAAGGRDQGDLAALRYVQVLRFRALPEQDGALAQDAGRRPVDDAVERTVLDARKQVEEALKKMLAGNTGCMASIRS